MNHLKINLPVFILILFSPFLYSQIGLSKQFDQVSNSLQRKIKPQHCGVQAALLAQDLETGQSLSKMKNKYILSDYDVASYVPALVRVSDDFKEESFADFDIQVNTALTYLYLFKFQLVTIKPFSTLRESNTSN